MNSITSRLYEKDLNIYTPLGVLYPIHVPDGLHVVPHTRA
jgi:hypothetical protein